MSKVHFVESEKFGIHKAVCGAQFSEMGDHLTTALSVVTCDACKEAAKEVKSNVELVELIKPHVGEGPMPVSVEIDFDDLHEHNNEHKIKRTDHGNIVRPIVVQFGKVKFHMSYFEAHELQDQIEDVLDTVDTFCTNLETVSEIQCYVESMLSNLDAWRDDPTEDNTESLNSDLVGDLRDLEDAINKLKG